MGGGEQAKYLNRMRVYHLIKEGDIHSVADMETGAIPALEKLIETGEYWEKTRAVEALCRIDDPKATRLLKKLLEHPEWALRKAAVEILGGTDLCWLEERLKKLEMQDPDHDVRWSARKALRKRESVVPPRKGRIPDNFGNLKRPEKVVSR